MTAPASPTPSTGSLPAAHPAHHLALAVADMLADPADMRYSSAAGEAVRRQSLAYGAPGIALLHIELAARGERPWARAHHWLAYATGRPVASGPDSHPFYGAPAVAHALACAADAQPGSYGRALEALDTVIWADARARLETAHARIDASALPALAEFDTIRGLAGIGSYLLRRDGDGDLIRRLLAYLVRLTEPVRSPWKDQDGMLLPGWWTATGPSGRLEDDFPRGHGNNGLAHGIAGPLALLSAAALRGVTVDGHHTAIHTILAWFDRCLTGTGSGPAWPYTITHPGQAASRKPPAAAARPSWCYGAAGIARAQQLAALALGDTHRRDSAETILARALADPLQRQATTDSSLCHGFAGLAHLAAVTAADATPGNTGRLAAVIPGLLDAVHPPGGGSREAAAVVHQTAAPAQFLEGAAGIALAVLAPATGTPACTGWDGCLLTTHPTTPQEGPL
ncbi:lanthionine synthetase C family protein [Actinomadura viridis]|uniref:lanthionine synthetase C family protein n=1 Tax=Actinomadura viridis TaxID=58110 RepID=UPI0036949EBA